MKKIISLLTLVTTAFVANAQKSDVVYGNHTTYDIRCVFYGDNVTPPVSCVQNFMTGEYAMPDVPPAMVTASMIPWTGMPIPTPNAINAIKLIYYVSGVPTGVIGPLDLCTISGGRNVLTFSGGGPTIDVNIGGNATQYSVDLN